MTWRIRISLSDWTSRCVGCGVPVVARTGDLIPIVEYPDGTGDPLCDPCAQGEDGPFALLTCERIAHETRLDELQRNGVPERNAERARNAEHGGMRDGPR